MSRPDLSYLCFLYYLVGSGCDKGGLFSFCMSRGFAGLGVYMSMVASIGSQSEAAVYRCL